MTRRCDRLGPLRRQAPGDRAAPVVRDQRLERRPPSGRSAPRCRRQVLGAIGLDLGRRRRSLEAAQVRRDAAVAVARSARAARPRRTRPRESRAGTSSTGAPRRPAARQLSVMPCGSAIVEGLDHRRAPVRPGVAATRARRRRRRCAQRRERAQRHVGFRSESDLAERRSLARPASAAAASRRLSLSALVSSTSSLTEPLPTRGATKLEQLAVEVGEAEARIDHQHDRRSGCAAPRGSRPSPAASAAWRRARPPRSRSRAGRRRARRRASFGPSSNRLMCCVRPGVFEAKARRFCCVSDVDRGRLAGVGAADEGDLRQLGRRQLVELAGGGEKARGVRPGERALFARRPRRCRVPVAAAAVGMEVFCRPSGAQSRHCKIAGFCTRNSPHAMKPVASFALRRCAAGFARRRRARRRARRARQARSGQGPGDLDRGLRRLPHQRRLARQPGQPDPAGPAPGVPRQAAHRVQVRQARQPDHEGHGARR